LDIDPESDPHFDERMGINKTKLLRPKRMNFQFVEEGKWSRDAESIKLKVLEPKMSRKKVFILFDCILNCFTGFLDT